MRIVRDLSAAMMIPEPAMRDLVMERINDLGGDQFDTQALGYFIVIEEGDGLDAVAAHLGFDPLCNRFTGIRFDGPSFTPSFEFIEEFPACYDMVFIISDDGFGVEVFVPKANGIPADLLVLCQRFSFRPKQEVSS